jgi:predicted phosphatase
MRRKHAGYIFQFTLSDHEGRHIHVFKDDQELGIYDRVDGSVRGLEKAWNKNLQAGLEQFISELNEGGYFH